MMNKEDGFLDSLLLSTQCNESMSEVTLQGFSMGVWQGVAMDFCECGQGG
jgi:hypothetical protein